MKTIVITEGQTLMDVCIAQYGSPSAFFKLCADNGLSVQDELVPGQELTIDTVVFKSISTVLNDSKAVTANEILREGQSLVDVCVQELGSIQGIVNLCLANGFDIGQALTPGQTFKVNQADVVRKKVVNFLKKNKIRVNTGLTLGGIGNAQGIFDFSFDFTFE